MKLSVWSSYYIDISPEEMVLEFEKYGFRDCELSDEHSLALMKRGAPAVVGAEFRNFAEAHGMDFSQGHLLLSARICEEESRNEVLRQLDLFRAVGVKNAVLHCQSGINGLSFEEIFDHNVQAIRILADHVKDDRITICLENLTGPLTGTADALIALIEAAGRENVGICLDTGHLNLCDDRDQAKFIRRAGRYLKALHLADNDRSGDQHILPYAIGSVNFQEVLSEVKALGYEGIYNLEIPGERRAPLPIRAMKLDYVRSVFEYLDQITG